METNLEELTKNKRFQLGLERIRQNRCPTCGKKMKNVVDSITKKKSKYLFRCEKCMPDIVLMKG